MDTNIYYFITITSNLNPFTVDNFTKNWCITFSLESTCLGTLKLREYFAEEAGAREEDRDRDVLLKQPADMQCAHVRITSGKNYKPRFYKKSFLMVYLQI